MDSSTYIEHLDIKNSKHHDASMRTTLTLDDDVAEFLKEQSRIQNKPFKQIVNETVRRGMSPDVKAHRKPRFKIAPNRGQLVAGVDPLRLNQVNDEIETEDFARESSK